VFRDQLRRHLHWNSKVILRFHGEVAAVAGKRRVLQSGSGYIGDDALRRDSVPCSEWGASYYNCQPGIQANFNAREEIRGSTTRVSSE
jgi:hypothetical protein